MFKHVNETGNISCFLFDSHCANSRGVTDGEIGLSILMKFESMLQIEKYIEVAYQISGRTNISTIAPNTVYFSNS